ncbi:hypothetical protein [Actinopolyspora mortivallis]|uniref:hypothetical protein n=1 Tax=Actinopolyspora mortivallis TaxID=33906 RepID=UPI00035C159F|nr:hypothetical protein [Actinopolyspora mortivallis]
MKTASVTTRGVRIGVLGVNFGWGPHAALESTLREVRRMTGGHCRIVGFGSEYGRGILRDVVDEWCEFDGADHRALTRIAEAKELDVALVALEGFAARSFEEAGVRTVFLDLMPFLWRGDDLSVPPREVSYYLAMNLPGLKKETLSWMETVRNLRWIGAVVPLHSGEMSGGAETAFQKDRQAIVTLGGILGMYMKNTSNYPKLVLPGVLDALIDSGFEHIVIAGNVAEGVLDEIVEPYRSYAEFRIGALGRDEYLSRIAESSLCLTQPGLMSLLEASSCGTPLIRLPPQNVSGFEQAEIHKSGTGADTDVRWPSEVVDEKLARSKAANREAPGNEYVYSAIAEGVARKAEIVRDSVRKQITELVPECRSLLSSTWRGLVNEVGTDGASEAAEFVVQAADD